MWAEMGVRGYDLGGWMNMASRAREGGGTGEAYVDGEKLPVPDVAVIQHGH